MQCKMHGGCSHYYGGHALRLLRIRAEIYGFVGINFGSLRCIRRGTNA